MGLLRRGRSRSLRAPRRARAGAGAQEPRRVQEAGAPEGPLVQSVSILQNQFLQTETLLYYVSTKAGRPLRRVPR